MNEHEDRLGAVLKSLTDPHAPTDLRARLLDRLPETRPVPRRRSPRWAMAGVAAATAAVLIAGLLVQGATRSDDRAALPAPVTGSIRPTEEGTGEGGTCRSALQRAENAADTVARLPRLDPDSTVTGAVICAPEEMRYREGSGVWSYDLEYIVPPTDLGDLLAALREPDTDPGVIEGHCLPFPAAGPVLVQTDSGASRVVRFPAGRCGTSLGAAVLQRIATSKNERPQAREQILSPAEVAIGCSPFGEDDNFPWRVSRKAGTLPALPGGTVSLCTYRLRGDSELEGMGAGTVPTADLADLWSGFRPDRKDTCGGAPLDWFTVVTPTNTLGTDVPLNRESWPSEEILAKFEIGGCGRVFDQEFRMIGRIDPEVAAAASRLVTLPTTVSARRNAGSEATDVIGTLPMESRDAPAPQNTPVDSIAALVTSAPTGEVDYPAPGNPVMMEVLVGAFRTLPDGTSVLCFPGSGAVLADDPDAHCGRTVRLVGLDPDGPQWAPETFPGTPYPTARFVGDFDGETFTVRGQFPPVHFTTTLQLTTYHYSCRPTADHWQRVSDGGADDLARAEAAISRHQETFGDATVTRLDDSGATAFGRTDSQDVVVVGYLGEESAARALLADAAITNLCLVPVGYSRAQVLRQQTYLTEQLAGAPMSDRLWNGAPRLGPDSTLSGPAELQPTVELDVDFVTADIAAVIATANTMGPPVAVIPQISPTN
ncbi:hypothetical protein D1871_02510 [Nakamurella silvestris]|nr:hypothetical protein D1871_02510 [Nakamurella silvestris]